MKIKDFLKTLGDASEFLFVVVYYNENMTDIEVQSEFVEAIRDIFGEYVLDSEECLYIAPREGGKTIIRFYIGALEQDGGAE